MEKSKSQLSTSMETKLHDDEWMEILSKLHVKDVLRFKSVCKKWHSIISTPHFIRRHLQNATSNPRLFIQSTPRSYKTIGYYKHTLDIKEELPFPKETHAIFGTPTFIGTCNGLICYLDYNAKTERTANYIFIWNPSLRVSRTLYLNVPIGLDRSILFFWFGEHDNEYTLILGIRTVAHRINNNNNNMINHDDFLNPIPYRRQNYETTHHVHVIKPFAKELSTQEIEEGTIEMRASKEGGTLLNGVVHWLSWRATRTFCGPCAVFTYDLEKKVVGEIETPPGLDWYGSIGVIDGCLCAVMEGDFKGVFEIWMMKESWSRWMVISPDSCVRMPLFTRLVLLGVTHNGDLVFSCGPGAEVLVYNVKRKEAKTIVSSCDEHAKMYVESLVSPSS